MSLDRTELQQWLDTLLETHRFQDYCPNGLQLEGRDKIRHIITGVTASQALIDTAIERGADCLIVHHGWFWKGEDPCIIGMKQRRIAAALAHGLNIFAYHLPLDAHPVLGNNAQLGQVLGLIADRDETGALIRRGPQNLIHLGQLATPVSLEDFAKKVHQTLQRAPQFVGNPQQIIRTVAWCSGGGQSFMPEALAAGVDLFITGEASEHSFHYAQENHTAFMAAGHHATERYGVKALGAHIAKHFEVRVEFVDIDNPF